MKLNNINFHLFKTIKIVKTINTRDATATNIMRNSCQYSIGPRKHVPRNKTLHLHKQSCNKDSMLQRKHMLYDSTSNSMADSEKNNKYKKRTTTEFYCYLFHVLCKQNESCVRFFLFHGTQAAICLLNSPITLIIILFTHSSGKNIDSH